MDLVPYQHPQHSQQYNPGGMVILGVWCSNISVLDRRKRVCLVLRAGTHVTVIIVMRSCASELESNEWDLVIQVVIENKDFDDWRSMSFTHTIKLIVLLITTNRVSRREVRISKLSPNIDFDAIV